MERLACVDFPALPLQLYVARHADWKGEPAAVVDRDAPHGVVLWANERARRAGVLPGLRYGAALALCAELRAGEVTDAEIAQGVAQVAELLRRFSPRVEPGASEPGVFWADVAGLELVQPSLIAWARSVRASVLAAGFEGAVVVGFRRFASYAVAKALHGARVLVFGAADEEQALALRVPLRRIGFDPAARDGLEKLGCRTVGELLRLPAAGLLVRFGPDVQRLHQLASGALHVALAPTFALERPRAQVELDFPITSTAVLVAWVEELARPLLARLAHAGQAAAQLSVELALEDGSALCEHVAPAEATLDLAQLARLLRLRFEHVRLARGAERVAIELSGAPASSEQLRLFAQQPGRDPEAAAQAFAALRAAFGDEVVVRAKLRAAHLPEVSFAWERIDRLTPPHPRDVAVAPLIRRLYAKASQLPSRSRHEEDGWMLRGVTHGSVTQLHGPYLLSGGWWRAAVERDYYYAEMHSGELFWIYYDRPRRRWFLQGSVS